MDKYLDDLFRVIEENPQESTRKRLAQRIISFKVGREKMKINLMRDECEQNAADRPASERS